MSIDDALFNSENTFDWGDVLLKQMFKHKDGVGYVAQHEYVICDPYLLDYKQIIKKGMLIEELLVENDLCM